MLKYEPWEILFRRSPAGCEWASPEVASKISLLSLILPNQVWTFRLAKLEGVDWVDQVALHASSCCDREYRMKIFHKCVGLTWFSIPAFVPKHRVCHPRQVTQHSLESKQATALLRCEPVIPLSSVTSMSRNCLITYLHICYLDTVHTWMLYNVQCTVYMPGCCTYLDAVHTWMLYIPGCCT